MKYTQFVVFEITDKCNRWKEHTSCPNNHPDRWKFSASREPIPDEKLVDVAEKMYAGGFDGYIAFHHYCEPLMDWPRVKRVVYKIREINAKAEFMLWTNGDLFPEDLSDYTDIFSMLVITNYAERDTERFKKVCSNLHLVSTGLDWRINPPEQHGFDIPCYRPYLELIVDYYGNIRPCCMDWQGELSIGNLHYDSFEHLWKKWIALRAQLSSKPMGDVPNRCYKCGTRFTNLACYVPHVAARFHEDIL